MLDADDLFRLAHDDLLVYTSVVSPWYQVGAMHHLLADELMRFERAVARGLGPRLIIEAPVRHGKSELTSRHAPAWMLGRNPHWEFILGSYAQGFTEDHSRVVRNTMQTEEHRAVFPGVSIAGDSGAVKRFEILGSNNRKRGVFAAVGRGSAATGRGADVLAIDDPLKDRQEADSATIRRTLHGWYDAVARTRVMPGGGILIINTRWHQMDLVGHVEKNWAHEGWRKVSLPALSKGVGDPLNRPADMPLWPERWSMAEMEKVRGGLSAREWLSLYQQSPPAEGGLYFEVDRITEYAVAPRGMVIIAASDYAVTDEDEAAGDFTELGIIGIDHNRHWWLLDWWSGQKSSNVWIEAQVAMIQKWRPAVWFGEGGVIRRSVEPFLRTRMQDENAPCRLEWLESSTDKAARATSFQALVASGWLHVPAGKDWVKGGTGRGQSLIEQMTAFPAGAYDDKVDVLSLAARGMLEYGKGLLPESRRPEPPPLPPNSIPARWLDQREERRRSRYAA